MDFTPLIELTRGGTLECLHVGAVAVVNTRGKVLAQAGNPHWLTFSRSTLKALQALPFMQAHGPQHFGGGGAREVDQASRSTSAPCRACWTKPGWATRLCAAAAMYRVCSPRKT